MYGKLHRVRVATLIKFLLHSKAMEAIKLIPASAGVIHFVL